MTFPQKTVKTCNPNEFFVNILEMLWIIAWLSRMFVFHIRVIAKSFCISIFAADMNLNKMWDNLYKVKQKTIFIASRAKRMVNFNKPFFDLEYELGDRRIELIFLCRLLAWTEIHVAENYLNPWTNQRKFMWLSQISGLQPSLLIFHLGVFRPKRRNIVYKILLPHYTLVTFSSFIDTTSAVRVQRDALVCT